MPIPYLEMSQNRLVPPKNNVNYADFKFGAIVEKAADKHGVDPDLIRSIITMESNFISETTSPRGAMGLM
jgi:soluble lytic murein transglycosylase-like protein